MFKKRKSDLFVIFSCLIFTLVNGNYDNERLDIDNDGEFISVYFIFIIY